MESGFYRVEFRAPIGRVAGVVVVTGNRFFGGDSGMGYYGTLWGEDHDLSAEVHTFRHTQTGGVALLGADDLTLAVRGRVIDRNRAEFQGAAPASGDQFDIVLTRIPTPKLPDDLGDNAIELDVGSP